MSYSIEQFPTAEQLANTAIYKKLISAHRYLAELKGVCRSMPNQAILINTLIYAGIAAVFTAALGLLIAYIVVRKEFRGKKTLEFLTMLCFAIINQGVMHGRNGRAFQDRVCTILCAPN